jgi:DNA-binding transcriptional LysR family regulator
MRTFVMIAEELSFSRAGVRLNVAQPGISERLRRLEGQLGFRLVKRSSRAVELTREGAALLPHARTIVDAIDAAETAAADLRQAEVERLSIASLDYYMYHPERRALISDFVEAFPSVHLDIRWGPAEQIITWLRQEEVDLVFSTLTIGASEMGLEVIPICRRRAMLMVPTEHRFSRLAQVRLEQLKGCSLARSPAHYNPQAARTDLEPLTRAGVSLVDAPDGQRAIVEHFARTRRLFCLRWVVQPPEASDVGDMKLIPIAGDPLVTTTALWRRRASPSKPAQALWEQARALQQAIAAGPTDERRTAIALELQRPLAELT